MFHVKPRYIETWRDYHKALKSRNSLLRKNKADQLGAWEHAMWQAAKAMTEQRRIFINELCDALDSVIERLRIPPMTIEYNCGWQADVDLDRFLAAQRRADMEKGVTRYGLHRSDITVCQDGREIGQFYSRGQIKLCIVAISLALDSVFRNRTDRSPIILLDDLPAELDNAGQQRIIQALAGQGGQVFITTAGNFPSVEDLPAKMFHVEQGQFV